MKLTSLAIISLGALFLFSQKGFSPNVRSRSTGGFSREASSSRPLPFIWPPQVGQSYPDLELIDQEGVKVRLSSLKGKVLLIEPVGMNCPACLGWSGTMKHGPYEGLSGQAGLRPFEDEFQRITGLAFTDPRIVHVQLLLFGVKMEPTTPEDAKSWARHFERDRSKNQLVLAGSAELLQPAYYQATYNLVPGFQLVDKDFILRSDATSDSPKIDLWNGLLTQVPTFAKDVSP